MSVKLVVDNTKLLDLDIEPRDMEDIRAGFNEWMESFCELSDEVEERIMRLRAWNEEQDRELSERIHE